MFSLKSFTAPRPDEGAKIAMGEKQHSKPYKYVSTSEIQKVLWIKIGNCCNTKKDRQKGKSRGSSSSLEGSFFLLLSCSKLAYFEDEVSAMLKGEIVSLEILVTFESRACSTSLHFTRQRRREAPNLKIKKSVA